MLNIERALENDRLWFSNELCRTDFLALKAK